MSLQENDNQRVNIEAIVSPAGRFRPFPGAAVVFRPDRQGLHLILLRQRVLYSLLYDTGMLADHLPVPAIHMPLHELSADGADVEAALPIVAALQEKYAGKTIRLVAERLVNHHSASLELLLRPQTEEDYQLLFDLYSPFDCIQQIPFPLTQRITLSYCKPGLANTDRLQEGIDKAQIAPEHMPVLCFTPEALTVQRFSGTAHRLDLPHRVCFCCDGGLNRSVLAAHVLMHLAQEKHLPVVAAARAAFPNTQGLPVSDAVWQTLERHGIQPDPACQFARYLEDKEFGWFSEFAEISSGAQLRTALLNLPKEKIRPASQFFFGVRDPEYGEITLEQAYEDIRERADKYLEYFHTVYEPCLRPYSPQAEDDSTKSEMRD